MNVSKIILSSDENITYYQFWPLAANAWKKVFGVEPILYFVTDKSDDHPLIIELKRHGLVILVKPFSDDRINIPIAIQAKVVRMAHACTFGNETVMIGDIDNIPINPARFIRCLGKIPNPESKIVSFGANAYSRTADDGKWPMNYSVAKSETWKKVVNPNGLSWTDLLHSWCDLQNCIDGKESVNQLFPQFSDESLLRYLLNRCNDISLYDVERDLFEVDKIPMVYQMVNGKNKKVRAFVASNTDRIDRQGDQFVVRKPHENGQINLEDYSDIHGCRPFQRFLPNYLPIIESLKLDIPSKVVLPYDLQMHRWITGNDFRGLCEIAIDENFISGKGFVQFDKLTAGQRVFVKTDFLDFFFASLFPLIKVPFVLITHNSDCPAPSEFSKYLNDPKIIHWFGQNGSVVHPKFTCIPIGLANWRMRDSGEFVPHANQPELAHFADSTEPLFKRTNGSRNPFIYLNFQFALDNHNHRLSAFAALKDLHYSFVQPSPLTFSNTLGLLREYAFVASPHGNGLDCHRTWEAIIMGCIPIVKSSSLNDLYKKHKFPVLVVENWSDVTKELLISTAKKYENKDHLFRNHPALNIQYWRSLIFKASKN